LLVLAFASLLAGFVDAIVGGGGLIAVLFGVNKGASIWGIAVAMIKMHGGKPALTLF